MYSITAYSTEGQVIFRSFRLKFLLEEHRSAPKATPACHGLHQPVAEILGPARVPDQQAAGFANFDVKRSAYRTF